MGSQPITISPSLPCSMDDAHFLPYEGICPRTLATLATGCQCSECGMSGVAPGHPGVVIRVQRNAFVKSHDELL